jgi:hypothetical protein
MASASIGNLASIIASQNTEDRDGDAGVCGDRRTPEQKVAGKQNAADEKDGGDVASGLRMGITASKERFVCIDGRSVVVERTNSSEVRRRQAKRH